MIRTLFDTLTSNPTLLELAKLLMKYLNVGKKVYLRVKSNNADFTRKIFTVFQLITSNILNLSKKQDKGNKFILVCTLGYDRVTMTQLYVDLQH